MPDSQRKQLFTFHRNEVFVNGLVAAGARFLVVGGLAVQYYVPDREVDDLDILIEPSRETASKTIAALSSPLLQHSITVEQLTQPNRQVSVKIDFYLDVLTPGSDFDFGHEWSLAPKALLGTTPVRVAAIATLLQLLSRSRELKHIRDVELLRKAQNALSEDG